MICVPISSLCLGEQNDDGRKRLRCADDALSFTTSIAFQINILVKMIVPLEADSLLASPAGGRGKLDSEHHRR